MRQVRLVIFDLDGTLVNAFKAVHRSVNYAMEKYDLPRVSSKMVVRTVGWGDQNLITTLVTAASTAESHTIRIKDVLDVYRRHHHANLAQGVKFLPGARKLIERLHSQGYQLAIASNRTFHSTDIILECLGIKKYFRCVACADKIKKYKPDPGILYYILRKLQISAGQSIYVGDMTIDVKTGQAAGIKTIAVPSGSNTLAELKKCKPWKIVKRVDFVEKWVYEK